MSKKDDVCDLLTKINSEGVSYYFTSYTSADRCFEEAMDAGVSADLAERLRDAGVKLEEAKREAEAAMKAIGEEAGLKQEDYEY